jgi:hypothetical protein
MRPVILWFFLYFRRSSRQISESYIKLGPRSLLSTILNSYTVLEVRHCIIREEISSSLLTFKDKFNLFLRNFQNAASHPKVMGVFIFYRLSIHWYIYIFFIFLFISFYGLLSFSGDVLLCGQHKTYDKTSRCLKKKSVGEQEYFPS